ncbi:MAG: N-formylglutamate amidohydrolase [Cocleimonas sp.]
MKASNTSINLFAENEASAAELINPNGKAPIVLICEHASNFIPSSLRKLGLSSESMLSHAAWDIGAYEMACKISELLDAPLVASRVSRLVYDCNRAPESGIGIPSKSEKIEVPGNRNLSKNEKDDRVNQVYKPFHELIDLTIHHPDRLAFSALHASPAIITIHSFTPVFFDEVRSVELGILHDKDDRLAKLMMQEATSRTTLKTEFNSPYDVSDNVMHTINKHALDQGFMNVMIEVKNDLLSNPSDINSIATDLSMVIKEALAKA